ncbi:uncharacterized protein SPSK_09109 [Sporothrix schenckii 1099-18]|uniref:Mitochondrial inner membrane protein 1 n=1 Tax=Sporothrix schenckii 1099-18 TaxID=1397361 RepID=A0A0F2M7T5_SPOSC|nr:uncharacterized protein SPSK_09109 [Sporothrix schenckii 1099-18]KJR84236.1 hypothetical protein SPSK_09109 [Sporothrix schenckii 1099-18]
MLRSRPLFSPVRAGATIRNNATATPFVVGRAVSLAVGREAASQSRPMHTKTSRRVHPLAFKPATPPSTRFLVAYSTDSKSRPPVKLRIDREHEKEVGQQKLEARPGEVTVESSRRHFREPNERRPLDDEPPMMDSLKADANSIKQTLSLTEVPREVYALGLSGTVPYFLTSLSTVYLGWTLRNSYPTSSTLMNTFMVSHETAHQWLAMLEPIQLGFGAVIISFLGAVHWGMEFNEKTPSHDRTRFRYAMGVLAPAIAWPTLLLPVHFALTGQFFAFTLLYFADSRATKMGWVPPWYSTYRFVLTFVVGSAILVSLIFRAKIDDVGENMTERLAKGMHQRGTGAEDYSEKWAKLEQADKEKAKKEEEERKKQEKKAKKDKKKKGGEEGEDKAQEKTKDGEESSDEGDEGDGNGDGDEKEDDDANNGDGKDSSDDKPEDGNNADDKTKGDEKKGAVDGDSSSKKKSAKGDEESKSKK